MRKMIVVVAVLAMTRATHAQSKGAEAEVLFRQGKELMAAGKIAEACAAFDASQKLDPTVATLMNQANCREKNGQLATAWGLFLAVVQTRATTDQASQQLHAVATARAAKLEPRLSTLRIDVPAGSRIGGLEVLRDGEVLDPAAWNKAMPIDGGTYTIAARAPGNTTWSSTIVVATERDAKTIEIPRLHAAELVASAPKVKRPSVVSTPEPPPTLVPRETSAVWSMKRKIAVGTAGGGVLALAVGTALGVSAKNKQGDAHALCPEPQLACDSADRANDLVRSGHNLAIGADVAFGVGAVATIAAGVLWITGAPEAPHRIAIIPAASLGQVGVFAKRSF